MFKKLLPIFILFSIPIYGQNSHLTISGKVVSSQKNVPLENCNIYIEEIGKGTATDSSGYYKLELTEGSYNLTFSYIGFESEKHEINLQNNSVLLNIDLNEILISGEEVEIVGEREPDPIVIQKIENKDIQKMPTIYSDVLRSVQVLSGVTTSNELTSGYNVRGGTFDENLIYLNGYEIYRPFLLRVGVEENQTTTNPYMVEKLTFYNGAFPVSYGDRMASALDVNYTAKHTGRLKGVIYSSLLNSGLNFRNRYKDFNWSLGLRYANPSKFLNNLQTRGDYKPLYSDVQLLGNIAVSENSEIELLAIYSDNKFEVSPTNWNGSFGGFMRGDYRGVAIESDGDRTYSYLNSLFGLRYKSNISEKTNLNISYSRYWVKEREKYDLSSNIFYYFDAMNPTEDLEYLKSREESGDNILTLTSDRFKAKLSSSFNKHHITLGTEYRIARIDNIIFEKFNEIGDSLITEKPILTNFNKSYNLNSFSFFVEDYILLSEKFEANVGLRFLNYQFSNENLFSPRAYLIYKPSPLNSFKLSWGYYYQPPFINELRSTQIDNLKSQRSIHYVLGWETQVNEKLKFNAEIYYKDFANLIPFYFDEFRMNYVGENSLDGYAFGIDLMYEGEVVEGMKSWIGYSYLDTKQKKIGTNKFQRRLLDQNHTIQIFLQDKMRKHPNWQSHLRFLVGSGYLYYNRILTTYDNSESFVDVDYSDPREYFFYFRVDMGLSASFDLGNDYKITAITEVLNVFNRYNAGAYEWVHIFKEINAPIKIPHILSKRFLNVKVELSF